MITPSKLAFHSFQKLIRKPPQDAKNSGCMVKKSPQTKLCEPAESVTCCMNRKDYIACSYDCMDMFHTIS
jgi:hypothetical protein